MKKSELKALIRETIEGVQVEAKAATGPTYTFNQLNKLLRADKIRVFVLLSYGNNFVQINEDDGFYMEKNDDGEQAVHVNDGVNTAYEFGVDFEEVYVAQKVNIK